MDPKILPENLDDFGENRLLSKLNRRFSSLIRVLFRLPETWAEEPAVEFRRFLSRLNLAALSLLFLLGIFATIVCVVLAIREDSSQLFFSTLVIVPATFVFQFIISLFCSANLDLTFGRPVRLQSRLFPEVITIFGALVFLALLVAGILASVKMFEISLHLGFLTSVMVLAGLIEAFFAPWTAGNCEKVLNIQFEKSPPQGPADCTPSFPVRSVRRARVGGKRKSLSVLANFSTKPFRWPRIFRKLLTSPTIRGQISVK